MRNEKNVVCTSWGLKEALSLIDNTGLLKKIPSINFQYSDKFSPAKYEFDTNFFPSHPDSLKFYDKGLKINKICCL